MFQEVCKRFRQWKNTCRIKWVLAIAKMDYDQGKYEKACPVFEKFAEKGVVIAQDHCGACYYRRTTKDVEKALYWSEKAAEQGNLASQLRCVKIYSYGSHKDLKKAEQWLHTALTTQEGVPAFEIMNAHLGLFLGWSEIVFRELGLSEKDRATLQTQIDELVANWNQLFDEGTQIAK